MSLMRRVRSRCEFCDWSSWRQSATAETKKGRGELRICGQPRDCRGHCRNAMGILRKIAEWGSGLWITATSGTSAAGLSVQRHVTSRSRLGRAVAVFARRNCTTMAQLMASRRQLPGSDAQRRRNCLTMAQVEQGAEAQVRDSGAGEQGWRSWRKPGTRRCGPQGGRLRTGHPAPCHPVHAAIRRGSQTTAVTPGRRQFAIPAEES